MYENKVGRPRKTRRKAAHKVGGPNGPRLTKHGTIIHSGHCWEPGHNSATCARKKSGEPAVKKAKQPIPTPVQPDQSATVQVCAHPIKWTSEEIIMSNLCVKFFQKVNQQESKSQPLMSTLENPMVSQLHDEAIPSSQLIPLFFLCNITNWMPFLCRLPKLWGKLQWHNQLQILPTSALTFQQQDTCDLQQHPRLWGPAG